MKFTPKQAAYSMSPSFIIRPAMPDDDQSILSAFAHTFRDRRRTDVWRWIYRDNPDDSKSIICVSTDGEVAAHIGATFHRAVYQHEIIKIGQCRDAFSSLKFRSVLQGRTGLFTQTTRTLFAEYGLAEGMSFYYGFPSARHLRLGCKQLGYREGNNWGRFLCHTRKLPPACTHSHGYLSATRTFGSGFDRLWSIREKSLTAAVVHDSRFLSWRFDPRLKRTYWVWTFTPYLSTEMTGYVIFAQHEHKAILMDLHLPSPAPASHSFWMQIAEKLRWHGIYEIETRLSLNHPDLAGLRELGFFQCALSEHSKFCFRVFDSGPDWAILNEKFCFTMADADSY